MSLAGGVQVANITLMESSVSNVQFTERKKGFDPDEVANYLHQIDGKIAGMRAMASAAMDRAELAEERARQAERQAEQAEALAGGDAEYAARAASVLTMAQRTADATVSEARTEAARLLAEATTEAGQLTAASEAQAQQMLAEARREMEVARTEHLDALRLEVADLEQSSDAIRAEIEVLTGTLDDERARFRQVAAALLEMADSQTGLAH
jgi:cell division septum initiation protein DivIVA